MYVIYIYFCTTQTAPFFRTFIRFYFRSFSQSHYDRHTGKSARAHVFPFHSLSLYPFNMFLRSFVHSDGRIYCIVHSGYACLCMCVCTVYTRISLFFMRNGWRDSKREAIAMTSSACDLLNFMTLRTAFLSLFLFVNISIIHNTLTHTLAHTLIHSGMPRDNKETERAK